MTNDNLRTLVRYRLEQADEALGAAQFLLDQHSLRAVVNRAYYAMFYAVLLCLLCANRKPRETPPVPLASLTVSLSDPGCFPRTSHNGYTVLSSGAWAADYAVPNTIQREEAQQVFNEAKEFVTSGQRLPWTGTHPCEASCLRPATVAGSITFLPENGRKNT